MDWWLVFSLGTILGYGTAQQFSKKGVQLIGSYQTGILYAVASVAIQTAFWLMLPDDVPNDLGGMLVGLFAGITGGMGFVFYLFALKSGKISIVSVMTAGYPAVSVILAIVLIGEVLTISEAIGIIMVIGSIISLSLPTKEDREKDAREKKSRAWILWALLSLVFWGIWAIPSKIAMQEIGRSDYILIDGLTMVLIWVPLWLLMEKGRFTRDVSKIKYSATAGVLASLGTMSLFIAIDTGDVSIVTPLTSVYPVFTLLLARFTLKEKLRLQQYLAIAAGIAGIVMLSIIA